MYDCFQLIILKVNTFMGICHFLYNFILLKNES